MQDNRSNSMVIRAGAVFFGLFFAGMGLFALSIVYGYLPSRQHFTVSATIMATLAGGLFVLAGIGMILFGLGANRIASKVAGGCLLLFLLAFNWIAFGPGERSFTRTTSSGFAGATISTQAKVPEVQGRIAFGVFTGLMDVLLVCAVVRAMRRTR